MTERRDLPLFAWGEQHHVRERQRRLAVRAALVGLSCFALGATLIARPRPLLVWNASASAPIGLYRVGPPVPLARGDLVIAHTPPSVRELAARRHYIPATVPLVKRVAGVSGTRVCAIGEVITIDARRVATRRVRDRAGRLLPWWRGCRIVSRGSVFLLMTAHADSFDGRYFGPSSASDVIGKATPVWLR